MGDLYITGLILLESDCGTNVLPWPQAQLIKDWDLPTVSLNKPLLFMSQLAEVVIVMGSQLAWLLFALKVS